MKYLKWSIYFKPGAKEGVTPEETIRNNGGWAEGAIRVGDFDIIGYASDNVNLTELSNYNVQELTQEEALSMAQEINPNCYLQDDGKICLVAPVVN